MCMVSLPFAVFFFWISKLLYCPSPCIRQCCRNFICPSQTSMWESKLDAVNYTTARSKYLCKKKGEATHHSGRYYRDMPLDTCSLVLGLQKGEERKGLVSTACACAIIMQILNNPITYGYCIVYLPFDLNCSRSNIATSIYEGLQTAWALV